MTATAALAACVVLAMSMPAGYTDRLFTIIHTEADTTNSAQERTGEMKQALAHRMAIPSARIPLTPGKTVTAV